MSTIPLLDSISEKIIDPIILFLFALATLYFLYGVLQLIQNAGNEEARKVGQQHVLWGVVGMFIMLSFWGIMHLICNTINAGC